MKTKKDFKDDFILFLETGFIGVNQMDAQGAANLFEACKLLEPENVLSDIGIGYLQINTLQLKHASATFNDVLKKDPENEMAKAFLGFAYALTPDKVADGEKILEETSKSKDKTIKTLSDSALDFIDKFIKKFPSPVESTD